MKFVFGFLIVLGCGSMMMAAEQGARPHIVFVMADDMGWGQTGYRGHPVLKTPHLDEMAAHSLRFERFYAGGPVCSPTRASVLTGRTHRRAGVLDHGYALRRQEKTIGQALKDAGYVTGHFGKWHLDGFKGPGAPILKDDPYSPDTFGFDEWTSVTNFFDVDPLLSRQGEVVQEEGDSSDIVVRRAVEFLKKHQASGQPMFAVVWYGSPHSPFKALPEDRAPFADLKTASAEHYGELVALDRSVGTLRKSLRELGLAENTLLVFCSDNGGLPEISPDTVGGLRGFKASVYEGGLRVPGLIEWPAVIQPRITNYPACVTDLFPTVADVLGLPQDVFVQPLDGISLKPLFTQDLAERPQPLGFRYGKASAYIDNHDKLVVQNLPDPKFALYDLSTDPREQHDLSESRPERLKELVDRWSQWHASVEASFEGQDYPEGRLVPADPKSVFWYDSSTYAPYLDTWKDRWEFKTYMQRQGNAKEKVK